MGTHDLHRACDPTPASDQFKGAFPAVRGKDTEFIYTKKEGGKLCVLRAFGWWLGFLPQMEGNWGHGGSVGDQEGNLTFIFPRDHTSCSWLSLVLADKNLIKKISKRQYLHLEQGSSEQLCCWPQWLKCAGASTREEKGQSVLPLPLNPAKNRDWKGKKREKERAG